MAFLLTQSRGGPVDVCLSIAAELRRTGRAEVRVYGPVPDRGADELGAAMIPFDVPSKMSLGAMRRLCADVRSWQPDVVHAHDRRATLVVAALRAHRDRPALVQTYHGLPEDIDERWIRGDRDTPTPSRYTRATLVADAVLARVIDMSAAPSPPLLRFLRSRLRVPAHRLRHLDNGLDLPSPGPLHRGPVRHLLFIGILRPAKGLMDLLDALECPGVLPDDAFLTIAGDGPQRVEIETRIASSALAGRVRMLGFRHDVAALVRAADAVVVPSRLEQQPAAVIQAMAAGRPVLATDTGDVASMLDVPGAARFIAAPGDVRGLAEQLSRLLADPDPGRTGRLLARRAVERFSVEVGAAAHLALYAQLGRSARSSVRGSA